MCRSVQQFKYLDCPLCAAFSVCVLVCGVKPVGTAAVLDAGGGWIRSLSLFYSCSFVLNTAAHASLAHCTQTSPSESQRQKEFTERKRDWRGVRVYSLDIHIFFFNQSNHFIQITDLFLIYFSPLELEGIGERQKALHGWASAVWKQRISCLFDCSSHCARFFVFFIPCRLICSRSTMTFESEFWFHHFDRPFSLTPSFPLFTSFRGSEKTWLRTQARLGSFSGGCFGSLELFI